MRRFGQRNHDPYARPDHVHALAFSLVRNYKIATTRGIDYVVECIQGNNPRRSSEALKALFFALRIAITQQTGLPRVQEQRLINAASIAFGRDPKASFIEKAQRQDAGIHVIAEHMGAYVAAGPSRPDEKVLSLLATILDASLNRIETHGHEDLFGNNFPFDKLGRNIKNSFNKPDAASIYLERSYSILTAAERLESDAIVSFGDLYQHSYEHQIIEEARSAIRALVELYSEFLPNSERPKGSCPSGALLTKQS